MSGLEIAAVSFIVGAFAGSLTASWYIDAKLKMHAREIALLGQQLQALQETAPADTDGVPHA